MRQLSLFLFIVLNNLDKSKYHLINNMKRFEILESQGVDYLCEIEFDNELAQLSAYDFLSNFIRIKILFVP